MSELVPRSSWIVFAPETLIGREGSTIASHAGQNCLRLFQMRRVDHPAIKLKRPDPWIGGEGCNHSARMRDGGPVEQLRRESAQTSTMREARDNKGIHSVHAERSHSERYAGLLVTG